MQALLAGLIAVIAAFAMASRLMASRLGNFSRGDSLAAREAAEYGLNEIQAQLNTDEYGYLWVSKFKASTSSKGWGNLAKQNLNDCRLAAIDSRGTEISSPGIPAGVASARTIRTSGETTIAYQVTDFVPPVLPDSASDTLDQSNFCISRTAANNFGNLYGGSALITVTGTVTRGSGSDAKSTSFKLSRRSHVQKGSNALAFSFMILGDAYYDPSTKETFGAASDISRLNYFDGNICYGSASSSTCFTTPSLPKTIIGCRDLGSCLINNVTSVDPSKLAAYCANVKAKKKKKPGYTCNYFQQSGSLPDMPTPDSQGFAGYTTARWTTFASDISCSIGNSGDNDFGDCESKIGSSKQSKKPSYFPYYDRSTIPSLAEAKALRNNQLVKGCYFNNTDGSPLATGGSSTQINCLIDKLSITGAGKNDPNLIIYTTSAVGPSKSVSAPSPLLPVNIFLHGSTGITLSNGGISNSDLSSGGWRNLRILGKQVTPAAGQSVSCSESSGIISRNGNDLMNLFVWLPNASLVYDRKASTDNSYMVVWACEFTGPVKDGKNMYSIITPLPEDVVRAGLVEMLGSRFTQSSGSSYRGNGAKDAPVP